MFSFTRLTSVIYIDSNTPLTQAGISCGTCLSVCLSVCRQLAMYLLQNTKRFCQRVIRSRVLLVACVLKVFYFHTKTCEVRISDASRRCCIVLSSVDSCRGFEFFLRNGVHIEDRARLGFECPCSQQNSLPGCVCREFYILLNFCH